MDFATFEKELEVYKHNTRNFDMQEGFYLVLNKHEIPKPDIVRQALTQKQNLNRNYLSKLDTQPMEFQQSEIDNIEKWEFYYNDGSIGNNTEIFSFESFGKTNEDNYFYVKSDYNIYAKVNYINIYICKSLQELYENYLPESAIKEVNDFNNLLDGNQAFKDALSLKA